MSVYVEGIPTMLSRFPAGESLVSVLIETLVGNEINIVLEFKSNDDLFNLALITDAIRRDVGRDIKVNLVCKYFPYARQDRVCNTGESLSVKVAADFINSLSFNSVTTFDLHSDVSAALINNLTNHSCLELIQGIGLKDEIVERNYVIVSPDAGAYKKVSAIATALGVDMVTASKVRDTATGKITGTKVDSTEHIGNRDFLIIDDMCDGGYTFIKLSEALRPLTDGKIYLYVSHGLFTKGYGVFNGLINGIYTANLMNEDNPLILIGNKHV